nr:restriction endonuclease subunit S [uncultured Romboutsia sp.]
MSKAPKLRFKEFSGDWEVKKLGDECRFFSGGTPLTTNRSYYDGNIPFIRSAEISGDTTELTISESGLNNSSAKMVQKGDLLYALYGATSGEVSISKIDGAINQAILCIKSDTLNLSFLEKILRKNKQNIINTYLQGGQGNLSSNIVKGLKYSIPSIEEQEKIASFFSLIDSKISLQGEKVEALKDYKRGMMQKIFSRELRFKDDDGRDYPEWEHKKLNRIVERITRKNKGTICTLPLTISAQYGLVDQVTFFNKTVASANLEGYYLLEKGEFAYNKSYSTGYPFGAIKRLDRYDRGVLSSLYICFSILEGVDSDFLVQYFETSCWHKEISMIAVEGARNHGLLNISVSDFFETYHWIPCYDEQVKIGEFLGKIDEKINKEQEKLDSLNEYKKGLLQKMFV